MIIQNIALEWLTATSKLITIKARVGTDQHYAEAIAREKTIEEAEEKAIQRATERLRQEISKKSPGHLGYAEVVEGGPAQPFVANDEAAECAERLIVQLAGCGAAALGATADPAEEGDYGWSSAYQDVLELRKRYDALTATDLPPSSVSHVAAVLVDQGPPPTSIEVAERAEPLTVADPPASSVTIVVPVLQDPPPEPKPEPAPQSLTRKQEAKQPPKEEPGLDTGAINASIDVQELEAPLPHKKQRSAQPPLPTAPPSPPLGSGPSSIPMSEKRAAALKQLNDLFPHLGIKVAALESAIKPHTIEEMHTELILQLIETLDATPVEQDFAQAKDACALFDPNDLRESWRAIKQQHWSKLSTWGRILVWNRKEALKAETSNERAA